MVGSHCKTPAPPGSQSIIAAGARGPLPLLLPPRPPPRPVGAGTLARLPPTFAGFREPEGGGWGWANKEVRRSVPDPPPSPSRIPSPSRARPQDFYTCEVLLDLQRRQGLRMNVVHLDGPDPPPTICDPPIHLHDVARSRLTQTRQGPF